MATDVAKYGMRSFHNNLLVIIPSFNSNFPMSKVAVSTEAPVFDSIIQLIVS